MRAFAFALLFVLAGCGGSPDVESLGWLSMGTTAQLSFKTVEGPSLRNRARWSGRDSGNRIVVFEPSVPVAVGALVPVRITEAHPQILVGEIA